MISPKFKFKCTVAVFTGKADWYYAYLPAAGSKLLNEMFADQKRGWNSLRVRAIIGITVWQTSIFYISGEKKFMLPLKKEIRKKADLSLGKRFEVEIEVII